MTLTMKSLVIIFYEQHILRALLFFHVISDNTKLRFLRVAPRAAPRPGAGSRIGYFAVGGDHHRCLRRIMAYYMR